MLAAGGTFGDFDVVRELGRGGMGAVYLVRDPATGGEYAAKVMFEGATGETAEIAKRRFIREAEIAMAADHPNLVKVYDVGRDPESGLAYMIMDYVGGGSLHDRIARRLIDRLGPYTVKETLAIIRPLLSALAEAERQGVVHRDIKPDNILFTVEGVPKLADLGIAKVSDRPAATLLTMSNVIVGTPAYMAPEQLFDSHHVDARADLYSLGVVMWEMLAGERPNADDDTSQLMAKAMKGVRIPDIRTLRKNVSPRIAGFLRRMTEPKADRRFASADSALRFLDEWQLRQRRTFRRIVVGAAVFTAVAIAAILFFGIRRMNRPDGPAVPDEQDEFSIPAGVD